MIEAAIDVGRQEPALQTGGVGADGGRGGVVGLAVRWQLSVDMMSHGLATSAQHRPVASYGKAEVTLLIAAILATQFTVGGYHADSVTWWHLPAFASMVYGLTLHFGSQRSSSDSRIARGLIRGYMLIVLALAILVVGSRLGFPIASFPEAPNNQLHGVLRNIVAAACGIFIVVAFLFAIFSHAARSSPIFWLAAAVSPILISSTGIHLRHFPFL